MDVLIKQILDSYFSDFKQYHLFILVLFTILIAIIQIFQSIFITTKIEKFKNDLKKSEIKFSRYNELQIVALRVIYHKLASFQGVNNRIFKSEPQSISHTVYSSRINDWIRVYTECSNEFAREKILLPQEIKDLFSLVITDFESVRKILINEKNSLDYWEMENHRNWELMYDYEEEELSEITKKIENIKNEKSIRDSELHIRRLRDKIEEVFQNME